MKEIKTLPALKTTVRIPGSKSITHRAIIAASLAQGDSRLLHPLGCEDTLYTAQVLRDLGVRITQVNDTLIVCGTGGKFPPAPLKKELYLGNSGTSFRLLLSVVALAHGEFVLTGTPRMLTRPIGALVAALNDLSVDAACIERNSCPPVLIHANGIVGGKTRIAGNLSSQYLSSLLLSGPYAQQGIDIEVTGELVSTPYVDITVDVMAKFKVRIEREGYRHFRVPPGQRYEGQEFVVQGDASSASYFWAAAAITGGTVITENIHPFQTRQGDIGFLDILQKMGCHIERNADRVAVTGGKLIAIEADMSTMPDLVPTLAAVALFSAGKTHIKNVSHLRIKESDRLNAVATEWRKLSAQVEETEDGLIVQGGRPLHGAPVDPHDDHRIAMSLAVVGLKVPGIVIGNEECVNKSFPSFWELWDNLLVSDQV